MPPSPKALLPCDGRSQTMTGTQGHSVSTGMQTQPASCPVPFRTSQGLGILGRSSQCANNNKGNVSESRPRHSAPRAALLWLRRQPQESALTAVIYKSPRALMGAMRSCRGAEERAPDKNSSWGVNRGTQGKVSTLSVAQINQKSRGLWGKWGG